MLLQWLNRSRWRALCTRLDAPRGKSFATGLWVVLAIAPRALAFDGPDGFGKAKFGMTEEQFKAVYPHAQAVAAPAPSGTAPPPFSLKSYSMDDQAVGPLRRCKVRFRFFNAELYEIQFRCPDKGTVSEYLQRTFGLPTRTTDTTLIWTGKRGAVTHVPKGGVFSFDDVERSKAMQGALLKAMIMVPPKAGTPGTSDRTQGQ